MKEYIIDFAGQSHIGLHRKDNQDYYGKFPSDNCDLNTPEGQLFIVADGMGGHQGGKVASQMAVEVVQRVYFSHSTQNISESLKTAFETANREIHQRAMKDSKLAGMGTTCTALVLKQNHAHIAHVGDSRAYRIHRNRIEKLTQDHSKVAQMQREGVLTVEEARNHPQRTILNRALGIQPTVEVDILPNISLSSGDYFVLCTDGLVNVEDVEIQNIVLTNPPQQACEKLIQLANERGGEDNVTVQVVKILKIYSLMDKILSFFDPMHKDA